MRMIKQLLQIYLNISINCQSPTVFWGKKVRLSDIVLRSQEKKGDFLSLVYKFYGVGESEYIQKTEADSNTFA